MAQNFIEMFVTNAYAGGGGCYWYDQWGNCWSYEQVQQWWAEYYGTAYQQDYYERLNQAQQYMNQAQQQVQQTVEPINQFSIHWNDVLVLASQWWWLGAIFLVGAITLGIVAWRIFSKNKWVSELLKMWGGK